MQNLLSYFSFQGRANRQRYWVTGVTILILFFLAAMVAGLVAALPVVGIVGGFLLLGVVAAMFVAILANGSRRLHDRGHSAWWLVLFVGLPTLLSMPAELAKYSNGEGFQALAALLALVGLPFSIWGFIVMACLKGTTGPNKYGEDPLQPMQEVFA